MTEKIPDNLLSLREAWEKVTGEEAPSGTTFWRYIKGIQGIRLQVLYLGPASPRTTVEWMTDFILAISRKKSEKYATPATPTATPRQRKKRVDSAKAELDKIAK